METPASSLCARGDAGRREGVERRFFNKLLRLTLLAHWTSSTRSSKGGSRGNAAGGADAGDAERVGSAEKAGSTWVGAEMGPSGRHTSRQVPALQQVLSDWREHSSLSSIFLHEKPLNEGGRTFELDREIDR